MSQYIRPGTPTTTNTGDVVLITKPAPADVVEEIVYIPGAGTTGVGVAQFAYHHTQGVSSNSWEITHNLDFYPNVTILDSAGTIVEGEIEYLNRNTIRATFSAAFSGNAYLS